MSFDAEWERCAPWIQAALNHARDVYTLSDVEFQIRSGGAQFWPGRRAALVSKIETYPRATWLLLWLAGGSLGELRDELRPAAEAWGTSQTCTKSVIVGRHGWSKALATEGYAPMAMVVGKDLSP